MPLTVSLHCKHICNKRGLGLESRLLNKAMFFKIHLEIKKQTPMQSLIDFVNTLPPLLQLLLGVFVTLGVFRGLMAIVDFIEDKREGK